MSRLLTKHRLLLMTVFAPMLVGFLLTQLWPNQTWVYRRFHFYYIFLSSAISSLVGYLAYREYLVSKETKTYLLTLGFVGIAVLYTFHGLITPGMSLTTFADHRAHLNAFVFFGDISRLWISIMLFLQVQTGVYSLIQPRKFGFVVLIILILVLSSLVALYIPDIFPAIKDQEGEDTHFAILIKVFTLVLLGVACTRFWDIYRVVNNTAVLSLLLSGLLIMHTVVLFMLSRPWDGLWWLAHNLYLLSFLSVLSGLYITLRHAKHFEFFDVQSQLEYYIQELNNSHTQLRRANKQLNKLATIDTLTGLANRHHLSHCFQQLSKDLANNQVISVLFIDLDGFKRVNDSYGHAIGDELLKAVGQMLRSCVRGKDIVSRLGGDEFIVLLLTENGQNDTEKIAQRIVALLSQPIKIRDNLCNIGASVGISIYPQDGAGFDELLKKADTAMYRVKNSTKDGYAFFES